MSAVESHRIHSLDFLRGIAVLLVLFRHLPNETSGTLYFVQAIGWTGVDLFFVLSGFLISGLLFNEFEPYRQARCKAILVASRNEDLAFVLLHLRRCDVGDRPLDR